MITPDQIKAARELLGWSRMKLVAKARVGPKSVRRAEDADGKLDGHSETALRIRHALEAAGVEFIDGCPPVVRGKTLP